MDVGLKYVNNDACYPSLLVVGQIMEALLSGRYDLDKTAIVMSQTGGGCRATNYVGFIRRALKKAGMEQIPVISLNLAGIESNPGFHINTDMLVRIAMAAQFGDIFMRCVYRMRPYETVPGSVDELHRKWLETVKKFVSAKHVRFFKFKRLCREIYKAENLGTSKKAARISALGIWAIEHLLRGAATKEFKRSRHFTPPTPIREIVSFAEPIVSIGNQTGEGWFLTGEMVELIHDDVPNIVCAQPFGCLPNHVVGKGVVKALRKSYPQSNIVAIDYDPGASEVNQLNRIKLMLSTAQRNLGK